MTVFKGFGTKVVIFAAMLLLLAAAWQLSSLVQVSAFKVKAEVKDPAGIGKVILKKGSPPPGKVKIGGNKNIIYINTDIDYGDVFPGEEVTGHFTVYLLEEVESVIYTIEMTDSPSGMRANLVTARPYGIGDDERNEPDDIADGLSGDWNASGYLNRADGDTFDEWWVTFRVPDVLGDFDAQILVIPKELTNVPQQGAGAGKRK